MDEDGAPQEVAGDGAKVQKGKGREGGSKNDGEGGDDREWQYFGGASIEKVGQMDNGRGPRKVGVPGREADGGMQYTR